MTCVRRNHEHHSGFQGVDDAIHVQLEFASEHADDLLVGMVVFRERGARIDVDPRMRDAIGMNQTGAEAREYFANGNLIELNEWHPTSVYQLLPVPVPRSVIYRYLRPIVIVT